MNGLAEVVKKNSPTSGEAASGGIFFSPRLLSHEWGIILPWEYATSDELGIFPVTNSSQCTNVENDRFSSGGSRPLGLDALMPMKVLNLFIVLKLHRNLRFLINFEYYLIKNELENA